MILTGQELEANVTPQGPAGPTRHCLVTRESLPCEKLVRFVVGPDCIVVPDVMGKLPGRGLWLSAKRDIVRRASVGNVFARASRSHARVPDDLAQQVENLIASRCLDLIGLARRAGEAVAGFEKVRIELSRDRAGVLLCAGDAANGGREKLRFLQPRVARVDLLTGVELGQVFGRESIVHVAVLKGNLADRLVRETARLGGFRQLN